MYMYVHVLQKTIIKNILLCDPVHAVYVHYTLLAVHLQCACTCKLPLQNQQKLSPFKLIISKFDKHSVL